MLRKSLQHAAVVTVPLHAHREGLALLQFGRRRCARRSAPRPDALPARSCRLAHRAGQLWPQCARYRLRERPPGDGRVRARLHAGRARVRACCALDQGRTGRGRGGSGSRLASHCALASLYPRGRSPHHTPTPSPARALPISAAAITGPVEARADAEPGHAGLQVATRSCRRRRRRPQAAARPSAGSSRSP